MTTTTTGDSAIINLDEMEKQIRLMARTVENYVDCRKTHPSYGYTKAMIRSAADQMEGAIGLYMVITGQANHPGVSRVVQFRREATATHVNLVRDLVKGL